MKHGDDDHGHANHAMLDLQSHIHKFCIENLDELVDDY